MAQMDTASWYDDEDDDNLTTFLPPKAVLPVRARVARPLAAKSMSDAVTEWRRDPAHSDLERPPQSGTRRARPVPLPRAPVAQPERAPRRALPQSAAVARHEPLFVPAFLSVLGALFVVAMLLGRVPLFH